MPPAWLVQSAHPTLAQPRRVCPRQREFSRCAPGNLPKTNLMLPITKGVQEVLTLGTYPANRCSETRDLSVGPQCPTKGLFPPRRHSRPPYDIIPYLHRTSIDKGLFQSSALSICAASHAVAAGPEVASGYLSMAAQMQGKLPAHWVDSATA